MSDAHASRSGNRARMRFTSSSSRVGGRAKSYRLRKGEISITYAFFTLRGKPPKISTDTLSFGMKPSVNLHPIKTAIDDLRDRVTDGEASPKAIVAELNRLSTMIEGVME